MPVYRQQLVNDEINEVYALTNMNIYDNIHKIFKFRRKTILASKVLTNYEKSEAVRILAANYDRDKIFLNEGDKRICENCQLQCLATLYCELCMWNYLRSEFSNWTSGNNYIDDLIQKCQIETLAPNRIIEWIPFSNLQDIKYLTKGGFSEIYEAKWLGGGYCDWNPKRRQLERLGQEVVVLKKLNNESTSQSWFDEVRSHSIIGNKWSNIVPCFGLTQNPLTKDYFLVMDKMDADLRKYLKQHHDHLTWIKKIGICYDIIYTLYRIHGENMIHRDLHSGNVLYSRHFDSWYISDLGFCGPPNKQLKDVYGNLRYIAPELIYKKEYTFASDIYSIAMLMWEISSGQPPFANKHSDYELAMNIINGMRPKIISGTPLEYEKLMRRCWDANPSNRPDINTVFSKINEIYENYRQKIEGNIINDTPPVKSLIRGFSKIHLCDDFPESINVTEEELEGFSKIHLFDDDFPEPKNATEELEAYHSKPYDFEIPEYIEELLSKNRTKRHDFNGENDRSKRIHDNSDDGKHDLRNRSKKIKLTKNEEMQFKIVFQYGKRGKEKR